MTTKAVGASFTYSHTIGGNAPSGGVGFNRPVAVARGPGDLMYVISRGLETISNSKRVTMCTVGEDYIGQFGRHVSFGMTPEADIEADGCVVWPTCLAIDSGGNVYVSDEALNRVSVFSKDGDWISKWGTPGDGDGEINRPSGIAFDRDDNLFLVDALNHRVQKFTVDGKFLGNWGCAGSGDGEFNMPWGIDVDTDCNVYVADWRNDRIQKFTPQGEFLMKFGITGTGDGEFNRPNDVAVDKDGIIYVTDWGNDRLQVFDPEGSFITKMTGDATISKWGKDKLDANADMWKDREVAQALGREKLFWGPISVDVDEDCRIFVVESCRDRVQVYRKIPPYFVALTLGG